MIGWRDVLVAAVVASFSLAALALSDEGGARPSDTLAVVLLVLMAAPLVAWRDRPTGVVVAVGMLALVSFAIGYPGGPPIIPLLFAGGGLLYRAVVEDDPPVSIALDSALFVLVSLLGDAVHTRRRLAAETKERLRLATAERDAETQRQVTEERLRIARELHDVMAHTIATMTVQAGAALDALDHQPQQTRTALTTMRTASRQAMQELRAAVSLLRGAASEETPSRRP